MGLACVLFDRIVDCFLSVPTMKDQLGPKADKVENPVFETALVKVQESLEQRLTASEKQSGQDLLRPATEMQTRQSTPEKNLADELLKLCQQAQAAKCSRYMSTKFIVPISNICEQLVSVAGIEMDNRRKSMSPSQFEQQMFLKVNHAHWNITDKHNALQKMT